MVLKATATTDNLGEMGITAMNTSLYFDPNDPCLKEKVHDLKPIHGFCVVADITRSVQLKDSSLPQWASLFSNHLRMVDWWLKGFTIRKAIGDALMSFISEDDFASNRDYSPLHLFSSMFHLLVDFPNELPAAKVGIVYCTEAYPITFFPETPDIHGKDIDLTFRLCSSANPREIVMNKEFARLVLAEYSRIGNKDDFPYVKQIAGPQSQKVKGFLDDVVVYKWTTASD